jgi:hypothetical protein
VGGRFLLGLAAGLLLGIFTAVLPVVAIVLVIALLVFTVARSVSGARPDHAVALAGVLLGTGSVLLYGAVSTTLSCLNTRDFCGNANVWPLLALAVVCLLVGATAALRVWRRSHG